MEFKLFDDDKEITCSIVLSFKDEEHDINYIVYQDGTTNENGEMVNYASRFIIEDGNYILKEIEEEYEWDLIEKKLNEKGEK